MEDLKLRLMGTSLIEQCESSRYCSSAVIITDPSGRDEDDDRTR